MHAWSDSSSCSGSSPWGFRSRASTATGARTRREIRKYPSRATRAQAQAIFTLSKDGSTLEYKLIASNIENVVQAHIHQGARGANGPVGVFLYGPVRRGAAAPTAFSRTGRSLPATSSGRSRGSLWPRLAALMDSGGAYVNVHTSDGSAIAGPGNFPAARFGVRSSREPGANESRCGRRPHRPL